MYTLEQIKKAIQAKGYVWFDSDKNYDINIVGIRTSSTGKAVTNKFDDFITVPSINMLIKDGMLSCYTTA